MGPRASSLLYCGTIDTELDVSSVGCWLQTRPKLRLGGRSMSLSRQGALHWSNAWYKLVLAWNLTGTWYVFSKVCCFRLEFLAAIDGMTADEE